MTSPEPSQLNYQGKNCFQMAPPLGGTDPGSESFMTKAHEMVMKNAPVQIEPQSVQLYACP